jgi:hypothetical protein
MRRRRRHLAWYFAISASLVAIGVGYGLTARLADLAGREGLIARVIR